MHVSYTARDGGDAFKNTVNNNLVTALNDLKKLIAKGVTLSRLFSLRHEFPVEFNRLVYPAEGQARTVTLKLSKQHFPRYLDFLWWKDGARLEPPLPHLYQLQRGFRGSNTGANWIARPAYDRGVRAFRHYQ